MNSAELRVAALVANDRPFLDAFAAGASPHKDTARFLFGMEVDKASEEYTFAKSFTYRWLYTHPDAAPALDGGQLRTTRVTINPESMLRMTRNMNEAHPAIVQLKRVRLQQVAQTGRVWDAYGRCRDLSWASRSHVEKLRTHAEQAALNFPIQSTIGEIMNEAFVRAWDAFEGAFDPRVATLIIQCHDELVAEVREERDVEQAARLLRTAIEVPIPELGDAIIPAELKVGPSWGEMHAYEPGGS